MYAILGKNMDNVSKPFSFSLSLFTNQGGMFYNCAHALLLLCRNWKSLLKFYWLKLANRVALLEKTWKKPWQPWFLVLPQPVWWSHLYQEEPGIYLETFLNSSWAVFYFTWSFHLMSSLDVFTWCCVFWEYLSYVSLKMDFVDRS